MCPREIPNEILRPQPKLLYIWEEGGERFLEGFPRPGQLLIPAEPIEHLFLSELNVVLYLGIEFPPMLVHFARPRLRRGAGGWRSLSWCRGRSGVTRSGLLAPLLFKRFITAELIIRLAQRAVEPTRQEIFSPTTFFSTTAPAAALFLNLLF